MLKLLHAADFHLDSPFSGLSPQIAADRRQHQRYLVEEMVELANSNQCDLVLLPGDLLDSDRIYPETLDFLTKTLANCACPVCIAPGNHDFYAPGSPYALPIWSDNVHIFTENSLNSIEFPQIDCTVWGAAFTGTDSPALLTNFTVPHQGATNLMVLHGDLGGQNTPYNPISREEIAASGLDYLALGHIHKRSDLIKFGKTALSYCGCPMGRGFDELGEKGVYLVTISQGETTAQFLPLFSQTYEIYKVAVENNVETAIEKALAGDTSNQIVRLILEGSCPAPNVKSLYETYAPRCHSLTIRDHTTPPVNIWAKAGEDTLRGLFLQELSQNQIDDPELCKLAAQLGLACMEGREVPEP